MTIHEHIVRSALDNYRATHDSRYLFAIAHAYAACEIALPCRTRDCNAFNAACDAMMTPDERAEYDVVFATHRDA